VTGINICTNCIPYCDTCIDCCIGKDKQILDTLSSNKSFKVHIQESLDIVDAFFRVIPTPKRNHPSLKDIFLPLEKNDEIQVVQFIECILSKTHISKLGRFFKKIKVITAFQILKSYQHLFHCN
jgi:hypothetical protein